MKIEVSKREAELIQSALEHYAYAIDGLTVRGEMQRGFEVLQRGFAVQRLLDRFMKKGGE